MGSGVVGFSVPGRAFKALGLSTLQGSLGLLCLKQWPGALGCETPPVQTEAGPPTSGRGVLSLSQIVMRRVERRGGGLRSWELGGVEILSSGEA